MFDGLTASRRRFLAATGALLMGGNRTAAAADRLEPFTTPRAGSSSQTHHVFDTLLARYVRASADGINRVDYASWLASAADRRALAEYIDQLSAVSPSTLERDEQFAFWANLYNAVTLRVVLNAYPVPSIRAIRTRLLALGPWDDLLVRVQGIDLSLNDIEHGILRPRWRDPRVHYAVNCASLSCPNLGKTALLGKTLDADLAAAARAYVNHPRGARIAGRQLVVSSIYKWYRDDFGGSDVGVIAHLREHAASDLKAQLLSASRVSNHDYDWSLNDLTHS